jgi:hypothetical protein
MTVGNDLIDGGKGDKYQLWFGAHHEVICDI